jgi:hypothetical protein
LYKSLAGLRRLGLVEVWRDEDIKAGSNWDSLIRDELERADVIVFLVSYDCCDSDYLMEVEFERAMARRAEGVEIIPLVVTYVDYRGTPFGQLEGRVKLEQEILPVEQWQPQKVAYGLVAQEIRKIAEARAAGTPTDREGTRTVPPSVPRGFWAPERRDLVVGRTHSIGSLASVLRRDPEQRVVALVGNGGVGKTTIALEYAWQYAGDYDLVAWLRAEDRATLAWDCGRMATHIGIAATDLNDAKASFRQWLAINDRWLIVFDNAVDLAAVRECLPPDISGHVVITSRNRGWAELAVEQDVGRLSADYAADMLRQLTGDTDAAAAAELADLLECLPLALHDAAAAVKEQRTSLRSYIAEHQSRLARGVAQ